VGVVKAYISWRYIFHTIRGDTMGTYKEPLSSVLILGGANEKALKRLYDLLRNYGRGGLKVYVFASGSAKDLGALREFILSNYTFTIEIYTAGESDLRRVLEREGSRVVKVLVPAERPLEDLPENLRKVVEVL